MEKRYGGGRVKGGVGMTVSKGSVAEMKGGDVEWRGRSGVNDEVCRSS